MFLKEDPVNPFVNMSATLSFVSMCFGIIMFLSLSFLTHFCLKSMCFNLEYDAVLLQNTSAAALSICKMKGGGNFCPTPLPQCHIGYMHDMRVAVDAPYISASVDEVQTFPSVPKSGWAIATDVVCVLY